MSEFTRQSRPVGIGLAIDVRHLMKEYRKRNAPPLRAVDDISFSVRSGEIFGLLGPNGAGKTTTLKILTTLIAPTAGSASILGFDVQRQPLDVRKNICVVLQKNAIELHLSVRNNFRTFGRFHGLSSREIEQRMGMVVELFGLAEHLNEKGMDLSGGMKRRVQVAKMFLIDKPIVFLDEATTGMDTFTKRTTLNAIKEESRRGRTIVLTTHILEEAEELCGSLAIINRGKLIAQGSIDEVKSMGLRLFYLTLTFESLTKRTLQGIRKRKPIRLDVKNSIIDVTVRDENAAFAILADAKKARGLRSFEITSASLEDVFVELIDKQGLR